MSQSLDNLRSIVEDLRYSCTPEGDIIGPSGKKRKLHAFKGKRGDLYFTVAAKPYPLKISVARYVCFKYNGEPSSPDLQVNHIDGDYLNNSPENLEWCTQSYNQRHRYRVLKHPPVVGHKKIDQGIADKIRELRKGGKTYKELTEMYGLCKSTISYIINNKTWKHSSVG